MASLLSRPLMMAHLKGHVSKYDWVPARKCLFKRRTEEPARSNSWAPNFDIANFYFHFAGFCCSSITSLLLFALSWY